MRENDDRAASALRRTCVSVCVCVRASRVKANVRLGYRFARLAHTDAFFEVLRKVSPRILSREIPLAK